MKILCQERYDKAVAYAKEIKNDTLQKCIDRLKQWEENPNCPCEIELYYDSAPHSFGFRQVYPDGRTGIVGGLLLSRTARPIVCRIDESYSRVEHTHLKKESRKGVFHFPFRDLFSS